MGRWAPPELISCALTEGEVAAERLIEAIWPACFTLAAAVIGDWDLARDAAAAARESPRVAECRPQGGPERRASLSNSWIKFWRVQYIGTSSRDGMRLDERRCPILPMPAVVLE